MTETRYNYTAKTAELKLGDVVKVFEGPWGTAMVQKVTETDVYFHRPYSASADFTMGESVIAYTGLEEYSVSRTSKTEWFVYNDKPHLK